MIMQEICHVNYNNVLMLYSKQKHKRKIEKDLKEYNTKLESENEVTISYSLNYYAQLISLLSEMTKEQNRANESKC